MIPEKVPSVYLTKYVLKLGGRQFNTKLIFNPEKRDFDPYHIEILGPKISLWAINRNNFEFNKVLILWPGIKVVEENSLISLPSTSIFSVGSKMMSESENRKIKLRGTLTPEEIESYRKFSKVKILRKNKMGTTFDCEIKTELYQFFINKILTKD